MPRYLFVTGKLAAQSLSDQLIRLAPEFDYEVAIMPITVAALMDTRFIAKNLHDSHGCDQVMIPGLCNGDLEPLKEKLGVEVIRGPKSLKDLPAYFGRQGSLPGYGEYHTRILAEIVDAYKLSLDQIIARAEYYRSSGADIIDLGCPVHGSFPEVESVVAALKSAGFTVSLDTFNQDDALKADQAGLDFLLSVNSTNLELAKRLSCKVVVIPDFDQGLESLERSIAQLDQWGVAYIIDPILNPISFGFTESLCRYAEVRRRYPKAEMMMGLGNLTELTEADSTGIHAVMAGVLAELNIDYVLTTEVINWARGGVRELDIARKLMHYACRNQVLPKHLNSDLVTLKDPPFEVYSEAELRAMHALVKDRNFRIFADRETVYIFNNQLFLKGLDPQALFAQLDVQDAGHAFYLARELYRAVLAVRLGKSYLQETDLRWGYRSEPGS